MGMGFAYPICISTGRGFVGLEIDCTDESDVFVQQCNSKKDFQGISTIYPFSIYLLIKLTVICENHAKYDYMIAIPKS